MFKQNIYIVLVPSDTKVKEKMANKTRTREITIVEKGGTFASFFKRHPKEKKDFDFEGISALRRLLSNEKARLLNVIKTQNPGSLYELARILKRDFKSVTEDVKLMQRFGFLDMVAEKTGNRIRHKPILAVDSIWINVKV